MISGPVIDESAGFIHNGIDRIDNDGPYSSANSRPCCTMCNFMKRTMTSDEFIRKAKDIAARH
jgi:hypothetical protein